MSVVVPEEAEKKAIYPPQILHAWIGGHTPNSFFHQLKSKVLGQDEELKKAAILIYGYIVAMANSAFDRKFHFMIEGSSGCGKSTFAKALQELLPCPVICADASSITPAGYRGADVADLLSVKELESFYGCGVLILDEADKLMEPASGSEGNFHLEVLHSCLKMLDGGVITARNGDTLLCDKLLVIAMGAFTSLRKPKTEVTRRSIGFGVDASTQGTHAAQESPESYINKEMMLNFCGSEQFLGRFLTVLHFKKLGKEVFLRLIDQTEIEIRTTYGCGFSLSQERKDMLLEAAMTTEYGARGIKSAVWEAFLSEPEWVIKKRQRFARFDDFIESEILTA